MKIHFTIPFFTKFGQRIYIFGSIPELSSFEIHKAHPLSYNNSIWSFSLEINNCESFEYSYFIKYDSGEIEFEAGQSRKFYGSLLNEYFVRDEWYGYSDESPFLSTAFKQVFYSGCDVINEFSEDLFIRLSANNTPQNSEILICGDNTYLGNWKYDKAKKLHKNIDGNWEIALDKKKLSGVVEYKFIQIVNNNDIKTINWESGENRKLELSDLELKAHHIINHCSINLEAKKTRLAGTSVPVFSLRSEDSCGIGDFMDLIKMIDFLHKTNQNVLQLLPVNDTTMTHTWLDSYPYGAISIYALHPLYINLKAIGIINDEAFLKSFNKKAKVLNDLKCIDYEAVAKLKWSYLTKIHNQEGSKTFNTKEYKSFFKKNTNWLLSYATFCALRDLYKSAEFCKWPNYSIYKNEDIEHLTDESSTLYSSIAIHFFVQFHLHKQLTYVHNYATSKRIILKGDIPIGVNRNSVEAWVEPHLFNFGGQAGAPPDDFSVKGQNWGFPTYNWDNMESDGYSWWKKRFRKMSEYFDAYRIDHILGFFRIWEIPIDSIEGLMGHFNPSLPFTKEEILENGYQFHFERDCKPYIKEWMLNEYFGWKKDAVKSCFLDNHGWENYSLKEEFNTQSKINKYFIKNPDSDLNKTKNDLFSLCSEVLFLQDSVDTEKFHPRISAQFTKSYNALENWQKDRYSRIYNNYFYQRNDDFWFKCAMKKLPSLISSTGMLVCGEDLGMIPSCVPSVMNSLRILSLEIQRMPKDPKEKFANPSRYPYMSVCTTGTHDTSTLRSWWEENYDSSRQYFKEILGEEGTPPYYCEPWLCSKIIYSHLNSPSMLSIFPLQDWLSISGSLRREIPHEERINIPSNPNHYWKYRLHLNIDDMINDEEFTSDIRNMIHDSGRVLE